MEEINSAFTGPSTPIQVLRKNEEVSETLLLRSTRHYRIPLPNKPTAITVTIKVSDGVEPTLYASTNCERPNSKDHELCGRDNKLVYEHVLTATDELEGAVNIDRRSAVPSSRELFLGVEAEAAECSFRLTVTFKHIKVVLSRAEIAFRMQNIRQGWKAQLVQLHREPLQREQFEEHVLALQEEKEFAKRERHRGKNFVNRNMRSLEDASPRTKRVMLQQRAAAVSAKHDEVAIRREKLERDLNLRNTCWISHCEERRQRQAHEHARQLQMQQMQEFQCQWLSRLTAIAFALRVGFEFQMTKEERVHIRSRVWACGVLRKFLVRKLFRRRRTQQYSNVIKMRIISAVFSRMVRPAVMCASQNTISGFLSACALNPESLAFGNALRRFRIRVIRIQRWWHGIHQDSRIYIAMFLERWTVVQASLDKDPVRRRTELSSSARKSVKAGTQQFAQVVRTMSQTALPDNERLQMDSPGQLPLSLARTVVSGYVSSMRRSYGKRMKEWEKGKQAAQWARDLEAFGVRADKPVRSRQTVSKRPPQRLYADMEELDRMIRHYEDAWRTGGLKVERFQHLRPLKHLFAVWARTAKS